MHKASQKRQRLGDSSMRRTGDQAFIKDMNKSIVLNMLRFRSPISRVDIARTTGLNKATVSGIVDELITEEYVTEIGHGHSQVGRRPVLLQFNPDVGRVFGVDLGTHEVHVLELDLAAHIRATYDEPLQSTAVADTVVTIADLLRRAIAQANPTRLGVIGVGIGVPGLVDARRGVVYNAPNLGWQDVPLKRLLEDEIHLPTFIDNEANAGAMGEKLFGGGQDVASLIYVSAEAGIGTGIFFHNEILRGESGFAGEFGHMTIDVNGPRCTCGNHGCLEVYASEKALLDHYMRLRRAKGSSAGNNSAATDSRGNGDDERPSLDGFLQRLQAGDSAAIESTQRTGYYLGVGIATLMNGLNPSLVLIGNRLAEAGEWLLRPTLKAIQERSFIAPHAHFRVELSTLGRNACAIGAASLVLHTHFADPSASV